MEILKVKDEKVQLALTKDVLPCLKEWPKATLFSSCSGIDYLENEQKLIITFYNFADANGVYRNYKALLLVSDYYLNTPDKSVMIIFNYSTLSEDKTHDRVYKSIVYSGNIDRTAPILLEPIKDINFMQLVLTNVVKMTLAVIPPKPSLVSRVKHWFNRIVIDIKDRFNSWFPKPDPTKKPIEQTSFISVYSKHELENRIFDTDKATSILNNELKGIEDPIEPPAKSKYENAMRKIRNRKEIVIP